MQTSNTAQKTKVLVSGFMGKMGSHIVNAVYNANDLELAGGYDPAQSDDSVLINGKAIAPAFNSLTEALETVKPDVMVDFTTPSAAALNLQTALSKGVDCVLGTTGTSTETLQSIAQEAPEGCALFFAPNYTTGAVIMMAASKLAAAYFEDVDIIEFHHNNKKDAPSGTAIATAELIATERKKQHVKSQAPGAETELLAFEGARGAELAQSDVHLHAVRSNGYMASQEVLFGSPGQTLSIRHDSTDRNAYMPGVLLAIRKVGSLSGLVIGLEELMEL